MADLTQTAANVVAVSPSTIISGTSGSILANIAVQAGMPVFFDGTYWRAGGAGGNIMQSGNTGCGIALNRADGQNQPLSIWQAGTINLGAVLTAGQTYVMSATGGTGPGGNIAPVSDLVTGNWVTILGVANNTNNLYAPKGILVSGTAK